MGKENFKFFVKGCVSLFRRAKAVKKITGRITRGRAASCAAEVENLFARAIGRVLPKYKFIIDCPLTYKSRSSSSRTMYPDILVYECSPDGLILKGIVEIKIDLGYVQGGWLKSKEEDWSGLKKATEVSCNEFVGDVRKIFKRKDFQKGKKLLEAFDRIKLKKDFFEKAQGHPRFYQVKKGKAEAKIKEELEKQSTSELVRERFIEILYGKRLYFKVDKNFDPIVVIVSRENDHGRISEFNEKTFFLMKQHPNDYSVRFQSEFIKEIVTTKENLKEWARLEKVLKSKLS